MAQCDTCKGSGEVTCPECHGSGTAIGPDGKPGTCIKKVTCTDCGGTGKG